MKVKYDLHIHSCLSPCGDDDMTPNNIVNMAALAGLDIIALTDHNACGNCRAAMEVAHREYPGMLVLPGMELTTEEEIHVVCLFAMAEGAEGFESRVLATQPKVKNNPDFFGRQILMDSFDNETGERADLLITATGIQIGQVCGLAREYGGIAVAAHLDRPSNSVISNLGFMDADWGFTAVEVSRKLFGRNMADFLEKNHLLLYNYLMDSDAHTLGDIGSAGGELELPGLSAEALFGQLRKSR